MKTLALLLCLFASVAQAELVTFVTPTAMTDGVPIAFSTAFGNGTITMTGLSSIPTGTASAIAGALPNPGSGTGGAPASSIFGWNQTGASSFVDEANSVAFTINFDNPTNGTVGIGFVSSFEVENHTTDGMWNPGGFTTVSPMEINSNSLATVFLSADSGDPVVPEFIGATEVVLTQPSNFSFDGTNYAYFNIDVTGLSAVPEPSSFASLGLLSCGLVWRRRRE